jgi:2-desacetyl-2-hydroxyethyl bacteriochlorophyllide A dehydrogenase
MNAIQLKEPGKLSTIEIQEPQAPKVGEALVTVRRVGICGTDIAAYLGKMPFVRYPLILGHELGVEVVAVGASVTNVKVGDRCSVEPYLNCGECFACWRGRTNCCEKLDVLGVHTDGGMRPRFVVPARKLHPSSKLSLEQLALVETLAIGCHAVNRAQVERDEWALVIGVGPIGLAVVEFLRLAGARIIALDKNADRLDFCRRTYGIQNAIQASGDRGEVAAVQQITGGSLPSVVFDATGSAQSMCDAFTYVAHTGKLVFVGIVNGDVSFSDPLLHRREVTLYASRNALAHEFRWIIAQIEAGRFDTRPWITHRTAIDGLIEVFPSYTRPETGVVKAMVELGG